MQILLSYAAGSDISPEASVSAQPMILHNYVHRRFGLSPGICVVCMNSSPYVCSFMCTYRGSARHICTLFVLVCVILNRNEDRWALAWIHRWLGGRVDPGDNRQPPICRFLRSGVRGILLICLYASVKNLICIYI